MLDPALDCEARWRRTRSGRPLLHCSKRNQKADVDAVRVNAADMRVALSAASGILIGDLSREFCQPPIPCGHQGPEFTVNLAKLSIGRESMRVGDKSFARLANHGRRRLGEAAVPSDAVGGGDRRAQRRRLDGARPLDLDAQHIG
jgi:hypothetical protein